MELEFKLWSVDWRATLFAHGHTGLELGLELELVRVRLCSEEQNGVSPP